MRCIYHLGVGLVGSLAWLLWVGLDELCCGSGKTTEFWVGAFLLTLSLGCRSSRYVQLRLGDYETIPQTSHQLQTWLLLAGPYLLEILPYSMASLLLGRRGNDILTDHDSSDGPLLLLLLGLCLLMSLPCSTLLGWKLSRSQLPAYLPVCTAASLCLTSVPAAFELNAWFKPHSFPLLPVTVVALSGLVFLLLCSRSRCFWLTKTPHPHPSSALACLLPASAPLICSFIFWLESPGAGLGALVLVGLATLFAVNPVYLVVWLLPIAPKHAIPQLAHCFSLGAWTTYCLSKVATVMVCVEEPSPMLFSDLVPYLFVGGAISLIAPALVVSSPQPRS